MHGLFYAARGVKKRVDFLKEKGIIRIQWRN